MRTIPLFRSFPTFVLLCLLTSGLIGQEPLESVPIRLIKNLIFLEVSVNESRPLQFLFDTGAGVTVIDRKASQKLALSVAGKGRLSTSGPSVEASTSPGNELLIGNSSLPEISLEIIPLEHLSGYLGYQVDGVIGYDLLKDYAVEMHLDDERLRLYPADAYTPQPTDSTLALIELGRNHFGIPLTFQLERKSEPITLPFDLDTACEDYLVVHNHTLLEYNLMQDAKYKRIQGFGASPTITTNYKGKLRNVSLGGKSWKNVPVVFEVDPISVQARRNDQAYGLIGQELLLDFNITYNVPKRMIHLERR